MLILGGETYLIIGVAGQGAYAQVYKCNLENEDNSEFVLKVSPLHLRLVSDGISASVLGSKAVLSNRVLHLPRTAISPEEFQLAEHRRVWTNSVQGCLHVFGW